MSGGRARIPAIVVPPRSHKQSRVEKCLKVGPKGLESDLTGFPEPIGLNCAAVLFRGELGICELSSSVHPWASRKSLCNNLCDLPGLTG